MTAELDCNLLIGRSVTTLDYVCIGSLWINIVQLKHILLSTNIHDK